MAKVGMRYVVAAPLESEPNGQEPTYGTGLIMGRAISADVSLDRLDNALYADDAKAESENSITGGTISIGIDDILEDAQVAIFGVVKSGEGDDAEYIDKGVAAPYVGVGYIQERRFKGVTSYLAWWYYKAQFAPMADSARTKGEQIEWQTTTASGNLMGVYNDATGVASFRTHKVFASAGDAITWLNTKANYTPAA